ncbi:MAG: hypothetical protein AB1938_31455 [Myxococcota bacterium]
MSADLQVKGFAWLNLLAYVRERHGESTVLELKRAFAQHEKYFDAAHVLPVSWVPGSLHLGVIHWLVDHRHGHKLEGAQEVGRDLASRNVSTTFKSLDRLEDLKTALVSTERAFSQFYSRGKMHFELKGERLVAHLTEFPYATGIVGNCLGAGLVVFLKTGHVDAALLSVAVGEQTITYEVRVKLPPG